MVATFIILRAQGTSEYLITLFRSGLGIVTVNIIDAFRNPVSNHKFLRLERHRPPVNMILRISGLIGIDYDTFPTSHQ